MTASDVVNPFAGVALDRAAENRENAAWLRDAWSTARLVVVDFEGRAVLSTDGTELAVVDTRSFPKSVADTASFLGVAGAQPWFAVAAEVLSADERVAMGAWTGLRQVASQLSPFDAGMFAYAKALLLWQTRARFCGACGAPTELRRAGHSAKCSNTACGLEHFPRTDAAVIMLVTDGPRALIGRQAGWASKLYSTLAGFVEPGECLEDALRREVFEESGVRVGECRYHSSQPWPFPASLMLGFRANAVDPTITVGDELEDALWITASELLDAIENDILRLPMSVSISFRLIADWLMETCDSERVRALLPGA